MLQRLLVLLLRYLRLLPLRRCCCLPGPPRPVGLLLPLWLRLVVGWLLLLLLWQVVLWLLLVPLLVLLQLV